MSYNPSPPHFSSTNGVARRKSNIPLIKSPARLQAYSKVKSKTLEEQIVDACGFIHVGMIEDLDDIFVCFCHDVKAKLQDGPQ